MKFIHKYKRLVKSFDTRVGFREIQFYKKNKLNTKMILSIFREVVFLLKHSNISGKSAQITYTFILAIVPFLSILFTFVHSLHGFENIFTETLSPMIRKHFGSPVGQQISDYLQMIIKNIQVKELGIISFFTFSFTVILLLLSIEDTLNSMMNMENHRNLRQRLTKCWIILTVSPFLFALTAVKSDQILHFIPMKAQFILEGEFIKTIRFLLGLAFQSLYFIFLYSVMPSKRLKFKSLLIGGLTASILFEILQYINIFLAKSAMSADPSKIYGTVPLIAILFFAWIRLSWIVALCGASVCLAAEKIFFLQKDVILEEYPAKDMIECVNIYCAISKLYKDTGQPVPIPRILAYSKVPLGESKKWISFLIQKEVLFSSLKDNILTYAPSYKALTGEKNTDEFLREVLFSNHSNVIRNYNDIEKHFNLCLKGNDIEN